MLQFFGNSSLISSTKHLPFLAFLHAQESYIKKLPNWCKRKPRVFSNILIQDTLNESVWFTLEKCVILECTSWLCICNHEYLELVNITLFDKVLEHTISSMKRVLMFFWGLIRLFILKVNF